MDLTTNYLGLKLKSPIVVSASPLSKSISGIKQMEESGAAAVVLYSLFEEQLAKDKLELYYALTQGTDSFAEATSFFPETGEMSLGAEQYLNHIREAKKSVQIPVIASINGTTVGNWIQVAKQIEQAGADALELNIYYIPTDAKMTSEQVEARYVEILKSVKAQVRIPVAIKLAPFFSNLSNMASRLDQTGVNGLVLFNRFYQPDIDLDSLSVEPGILLSTPQARRLPLRWIGILFGKIKADLAATSGIHTAEDIIKMVMVGANVTMLCSVLLKHGIGHIRQMEQDMRQWMQEHEYESISQMRGSMSQSKSENPSAYERALYVQDLSSYKHS